MRLRIETDVNAAAETVWDILAHRFANIADWSSTVSESRALGPEEVPAGYRAAPSAPVPGRLTTSKALTVREVLTEYSETNRSLNFIGADLPKIFTNVSDRQQVIELGPDRCKVVFDVTMQTRFPLTLLEPLLRKRVTKTFGIVQDDLRVLAESGRLSDAQQKTMRQVSRW